MSWTSFILDFQWLRPWWLLALVPALLLAWVWAKRRAARSHWQGRVDPVLLEVLLEAKPQAQDRSHAWILAAALACAGIGLAGPTWERLPQPVEQANDALVILLDLSLSMFAEDVPPSRLVRARQEITDVLRARKEGFTALIAYAGDAHAVAPLTDDTRTIENLLGALSPAMMPVLGSNVGAGLTLAQELFTNAGIGQGRILLVTDGVDRMGDVSENRNRNFPISILGIGTESGGAIPLEFANQPGRELQTNDGDTIIAKLDTQRLQQLAQLSYGNYEQARVGDSDIDQALATNLPGDVALEASERQFDTWADRGYWLALLALPCMVLLFRRGLMLSAGAWLLPCLLATMLLPQPVQAGIWQDLWQRRDQQAYRQLNEGQPEVAATMFDDPDWTATADYRSGNYAKAARHYEQSIDTDSRYNLANSQARLGNYQGAIDLYDEVLQQQPTHDDALFNKALVEKLLEEQQQASEQDNNEQQNEGGDQGEQQRDNQQSQSDENQNSEQNSGGDGAEDQQQPQDSEPQDNSEETKSSDEEQMAQEQRNRDENSDALEQWLRRVPDDPGGLLKRKFQYETKQRLRSGDYRNRESDKIW